MKQNVFTLPTMTIDYLVNQGLTEDEALIFLEAWGEEVPQK